MIKERKSDYLLNYLTGYRKIFSEACVKIMIFQIW